MNTSSGATPRSDHRIPQVAAIDPSPGTWFWLHFEEEYRLARTVHGAALRLGRVGNRACRILQIPSPYDNWKAPQVVGRGAWQNRQQRSVAAEKPKVDENLQQYLQARFQTLMQILCDYLHHGSGAALVRPRASTVFRANQEAVRLTLCLSVCGTSVFVVGWGL